MLFSLYFSVLSCSFSQLNSTNLYLKVFPTFLFICHVSLRSADQSPPVQVQALIHTMLFLVLFPSINANIIFTCLFTSINQMEPCTSQRSWGTVQRAVCSPVVRAPLSWCAHFIVLWSPSTCPYPWHIHGCTGAPNQQTTEAESRHALYILTACSWLHNSCCGCFSAVEEVGTHAHQTVRGWHWWTYMVTLVPVSLP